MPPKFFGQEIQVTTAGEVRTPPMPSSSPTENI